MVGIKVHWCLPCLILTGTTTFTSLCNAFSPEMFNQVIIQLGDTFSADALAFAAANLLDSSTPKIKVKLTMPKNIISIEPMELPQVLSPPSAIYDDDYQEVRTVANLDLTPEEEKLLQLLVKVKETYSKSTTIRIAGGWVRDKLIYGKNTPSRDIDLVLSDISGKEFADKVVRYVQEEEMNDGSIQMMIQQSSSSSKGEAADLLQNANLIIDGFDVDFCRLRYEKYDKDSRIPSKIDVASVVEDAWRRDLTINALYYNINTNQVEDWTEKGIRDLILQRIDTPKKPLTTLIQDPSRILRAVRFAAQLSFDMSPALTRAAKDDRVHQALQQKVSRDAIGSAIDDMFGSLARDPARGILLLIEIGLIDIVFPLVGEQQDAIAKNLSIYRAGLVSLQSTQSLITRIFLNYPNLQWNISQRRLLWYAAFLKPVYEMMSINDAGSKSKRKGAAFYQLLDALKRPKSDVQLIESILKGVVPLQNMIGLDEVQNAISHGSHPPQSEELSDIRWMIYKNLKPIGAMWKEALVLSLASSQTSISECVQQYKALISLIEDALHFGPQLLDNKKLQSLLNGQDIQRVMPGEIDGPGFRRIVQAIEEWQVRNDYCDLNVIDNEERKQIETRLVDYLTDKFPEYS